MEGLVKVDKVFVLHGLVLLHADYECRDWLRGLQHRKSVQVLVRGSWTAAVVDQESPAPPS